MGEGMLVEKKMEAVYEGRGGEFMTFVSIANIATMQVLSIGGGLIINAGIEHWWWPNHQLDMPQVFKCVCQLTHTMLHLLCDMHLFMTTHLHDHPLT